MMIPGTRKHSNTATLLLASLALAAIPATAPAMSPLRLAGALEGRVADEAGRSQMGATVYLYNHQDKLIERVSTDDEGFFVFAGLLPDIYSVRVSLATFLPAVRNQIQVVAGKSSLLSVNLSNLFSSIHLVPNPTRAGGVLADDWKWVLRSSSVTRPVFRYVPQAPGTVVASTRTGSAVFTDTRGMVRISGGDTNSGPVGEMGTSFALATNVYGTNQVEVAGNVGYLSGNGAPSAAFRATYSREIGSGKPEVAVTMRQLFLTRGGAGVFAGSDGDAASLPLRMLSVSVSDSTPLTSSLDLQYGFEGSFVSFIDRDRYMSPWARLTYDLKGKGKIDLTYTAGNARPGLASGDDILSNELQRSLIEMAAMPHVTLLHGRSRQQRGEDYEIGYSKRFGSRDVRVSAYQEDVQNAALLLLGGNGTAFAGDVLPDIYTDSSVFNAGNYQTRGYTAELTQRLGEDFQVGLAYGSVGVLTPSSRHLETDSADELRGLLHTAKRQAISTRFAGTLAKPGTHFIASYQIMDNHSATAGHLYSTQSSQPEPGLNVTIRQPIPTLFGMPFRMEGTVELRNLLAEGYLPVTLSDGTQLLLLRTPRSLRGGVNFRF